jgi:hypothetical protein
MTRLEKEKLVLYASAILNTAIREKPEVTSSDAVIAVDKAIDKLVDISDFLRQAQDN